MVEQVAAARSYEAAYSVVVVAEAGEGAEFAFYIADEFDGCVAVFASEVVGYVVAG